jgi:hypothetical protein
MLQLGFNLYAVGYRESGTPQGAIRVVRAEGESDQSFAARCAAAIDKGK